MSARAIWLRRVAAVLLAAEAALLVGLSFVLVGAATGAAALDGEETSTLLAPVAWGIGASAALALVIAAAFLWRTPQGSRPVLRLFLAGIAGIHLLGGLGAIVGIGALGLGAVDVEEPALDALWYACTLVVAAVVAGAIADALVRRPRPEG